MCFSIKNMNVNLAPLLRGGAVARSAKAGMCLNALPKDREIIYGFNSLLGELMCVQYFYPLSRAAKEKVVERSNDRVSHHEATLPSVRWQAFTHPDYATLVDPLFRCARKRVGDICVHGVTPRGGNCATQANWITKSILLFLLIAITGYSNAQTYDGSVNSLVSVAANYQAAHQPEKLYLQLDRSNYSTTDTLWFKAYLFNASSLQPSAQSNLVYIEISNEANITVVRRLVPMAGGIGYGSVALDTRNFPEGGYTLRAYTNWMRNFENMIFKKEFFVNSFNKYKWLIQLSSATKDNNAQLHLQLYQTNRQFVSNQMVQLGIKQGDRTLRWDKIQTTTPLGALDLDIPLPDKPDPRYALLQQAATQPGGGFAGLLSTKEPDANEPVYKFPVIINRPEKTDLQFMPESGYMVAGINTLIGFKALSEDGKGYDIAGTIVNSRNEQVAAFKSNHKGMGSFILLPEAGIVYNAVINLPDGTKKTYPLPVVKPTGTVLSVVNPDKSDSVTIKITASANNNGSYTLLAQSRGLICFAAKARLVNNVKELKAPKSAFATGLVRFTLLNEAMVTLNERLIYIDHHDNLQVSVNPDKSSYAPQDSIALHLEVKDSQGKPVKGSFSMSVVNNMQLKSNKDSTTIAANVLLTSDLKGDIEDPLYYFGNDINRDKALDELLLTQGWTGFDWKDIFSPENKPSFEPEPDFSISGKVINLFDKGVKDVNVSLLAMRPLYTDTVKTDEKGVFTLKHIPLMDSTFFLSAKNAKGKQATYEVDVDKPEWPVFTNHTLQMPWYVNTDVAVLKTADTILKRQSDFEKLTGVGKMLKEVNIKEKKTVHGSHNLNGPGNADQVLDEKDIEREPKITLLDLLFKQVKGFKVSRSHGVVSYTINGGAIVFIFDGYDVRNLIRNMGFSFNNNPDYDYYQDMLTYYTSYDVKGIEVMSKAYMSQYVLHHTEPRCRRCFFESVHPYIEVTTRQGIGPFLKKAPASIQYKPIPVVSAKEFYRPVYKVKNSAAAAFDQRTTIYWEPNIITDKDGKATVTFYAAGQPATYIITTEGSNMNGNVGSSIQKITVK